MNIDEEIKQLSNQIDIAMKFESYDEDEEYEKNKSSKYDVLKFILEKHDELKKKIISNTEFVNLFNKCILILINNTGCSEDFEILEEILDNLYEKNLIDSVKYKEIISKSNLGRWIE
ncbi:hypothetical protein K6Q96_24075 [Grimontia kaedaensis]|uniref:Uncharacterized protein n=1 Tax=Grimontia kaedaensis TaxID=2872157 RepID=A0ABY4X0K5_9GAMM|nr:hypothetical protein [Grimontia kaedaensis]USH04785.1 hypothetical protein K6Q96_24075 [Grimontia kaedaensis]